MRAAVESVALGLTYGLQRMIELGLEPTEARLTGSTVLSPLWRQLLSDALNLPLTTSAQPADPALGAAIHAAYLHQLTLDPKASLSDLTTSLAPSSPEHKNQPSSRNHEFYIKQHHHQQYLVEVLHGAGFL